MSSDERVESVCCKGAARVTARKAVKATVVAEGKCILALGKWCFYQRVNDSIDM